ncbi:MAG TPA: universal stress protein [Bacteroidales bacterium]|nr:universal stress protein [Bacteroidales bacterium]HRS18619.1 universal stress protein [Bacteroidales bacterium]
METIVPKLDTILVPTDFSEVGNAAVQQAVEIAKLHAGVIHLLHVVETKKNETVEECLSLLKQSAQTSSYTQFKYIIEEGDIFSTIDAVAERINADLIIMGTHGKVGFQKLLGSNALKVIDSTKVPLMVVQNKVITGGFKNILFPVSLADEDRQKTTIAIRLAKMFNSTIHIFPRYESTKTGEKQMISTILQIKAYFTKYDVSFEVAPLLTSSDNFEKKILDYSAQISADLIIIMSDSDDHFIPLFGSKEEYVLFNSMKIPVICVEEKKIKKVRFSTAG